MKEWCIRLSGLGALLMCVPVIYRIHEGDIFNPASYLLWSGLSVVCTVVLLRAKKGGHTMMMGYVLSDLSIGICAYFKNDKLTFGNFEWFIVALTAICTALYVWCESRKNFTPAVIANGAACMIAGIPQVVDSFKNPYQTSLLICIAYTVVSCLAYYGEKPTLNGRLIPGLSLIYWAIFIGGVIILRSKT